MSLASWLSSLRLRFWPANTTRTTRLNSMEFKATKQPVSNRGIPSEGFLSQLVSWGRAAQDDIFAPNPVKMDVYALVEPVLGPYTSLLHRRAVMLEVMRVHGMFESSGNWNEGVDTTNASSMVNIKGQETGLWQVSFDSTGFDHSLKDCVLRYCQAFTPQEFIVQMKAQHAFACEYYARLVRFSIKWAGPLRDNLIDPYLKRDAVAEFEQLLS